MSRNVLKMACLWAAITSVAAHARLSDKLLKQPNLRHSAVPLEMRQIDPGFLQVAVEDTQISSSAWNILLGVLVFLCCMLGPLQDSRTLSLATIVNVGLVAYLAFSGNFSHLFAGKLAGASWLCVLALVQFVGFVVGLAIVCMSLDAKNDEQHSSQDNRVVLPKQKPFANQLVGPTEVHSPGHMVLQFSKIHENLPWEGATPDPANGESLLSQLARGPCNWLMFASCIGFALPGLVHGYFGTWPDYVAMFGLLLVSISSPMCDAFCIYYAKYDEPPYKRTSDAIGEQNPQNVEEKITNAGAALEVLAPDWWNNSTRLFDRAVCVVATLPCALYFTFTMRPSLRSNILYFGMLAAGFSFNLVGQHFRSLNPCAFRVLDAGEPGGSIAFGKREMEVDYKRYEMCHIAWHAILILMFCMNALDRTSNQP